MGFWFFFILILVLLLAQPRVRGSSLALRNAKQVPLTIALLVATGVGCVVIFFDLPRPVAALLLVAAIVPLLWLVAKLPRTRSLNGGEPPIGDAD